MKKVLFLMVGVLALGLVFAGCSEIARITTPGTTQEGFTYLTKGGPTEDEADSFPLYAGQDWLVGEVLVWDDGDQVCVKYTLDPSVFADGWGLTETHLFIGTSKDDIPANKAGNPQVGHFPFGNDELNGVVEDGPYCVPFGDEEGELDVECGETLVIAAHAVIEKCITVQDTLVPELTWMRSSETEGEVVHFYGYGAQWTKEQGFAITTPNSFVWDGGQAGQYFTGYSTRNDISWASWMCHTSPAGKTTPEKGTDLRRFNATFIIPEGFIISGATLGSVNPGYENVIPMNDNIYIFMNEELIFWGGTISLAGLDPSRTDFLGVLRRDTEPQNKAAFPETDGWYMDGTFPAIPTGLFVEGLNNLDVFAEELWTGGGMHELFLTLQAEQTTCERETAWGAVEEGSIEIVEGKSWATYFEYTVECPSIPCMEPDGELSVTGTGWFYDSAWCPCEYKYDLTETGAPIALMGWVDTSGAALANVRDWSKYYAKFSMIDGGGHTVEVTFGNDWLGAWYEMEAQQWDRIRLENSMGLGQPSQYYATQGGTLGYDIDGIWVGPGNGATVYPSDRSYFFELIADPDEQTFTLLVLGKGSSAFEGLWPKQNMLNEATWLEIGSINVGTEFDFTEVSICAILWASTQAGSSETSTVTWSDMEVGVPEMW